MTPTATAPSHYTGLVLAAHPTSRGFGWVLFENPQTPVAWSIVHARPGRDQHLASRFERLLDRYEPAVFVLEAFEGSTSRRHPRIQQLCRTMLHEAAVRAVDTKIFDREVIASVFAETGATTRDDILPPTFPMNAATDKAYRGVNVVALWVDAMAKRYISGYWASYKQWQTLGAQVRKGEHGSSLIEQKSAIEVFADRNGLSISAWFEETETAAKQGRRMFTQMLTDLNARKADGLIIHKIDRSARNLRDWADLGDLIDRGVDVRFVSDNFDLLSRGGRLSADIQAVVAADYIRNLREEVKKGLYGRLKQGIYPFAAPIGYRNGGKGGKLKTIDPVTGPLVRYAFERYATRTVSFAELRHELAQRGLRTKSGKPLYPNSLTLIFNNPFYAGVLRLGSTGETFAGAHEPLIPTALFQRVQAILRGKTVPRQRSINFSFGKW